MSKTEQNKNNEIFLSYFKLFESFLKNNLKSKFLFLKIKNSLNLNKFKATMQLKTEGGFVLLIAVLLASIFGLIAASIFSISIKELMLSSGGKESQYAFYSADSGIECALYWDLKYGKFATSTHSTEPSNIYCSDQDVTLLSDWEWETNIDGNPTNNNQGGTVFGFDLYPTDPTRDDCVLVSIFKERVGGGQSNLFSTEIKSRGYNTCDATNPRRVERAIRVNY